VRGGGITDDLAISQLVALCQIQQSHLNGALRPFFTRLKAPSQGRLHTIGCIKRMLWAIAEVHDAGVVFRARGDWRIRRDGAH
jgi:hypothetical protein